MQACAKVRVDLDSKPQVLDQLGRKVLQLEIEASALATEATTDRGSAARLELVKGELEQSKERMLELENQYQKAQSLLQGEVSWLRQEVKIDVDRRWLTCRSMTQIWRM